VFRGGEAHCAIEPLFASLCSFARGCQWCTDSRMAWQFQSSCKFHESPTFVQIICCCTIVRAKYMLLRASKRDDINAICCSFAVAWLMPLMSGGISVEAGVHDVNVYEDVKLGRCDRNKACVQGLCPWYTQEFWWRCWCGCVRGVGPADYLHVAFPSACLNRHAYCISSYDSISCVCTVCLKNQHPSQMCS